MFETGVAFPYDAYTEFTTLDSKSPESAASNGLLIQVSNKTTSNHLGNKNDNI